METITRTVGYGMVGPDYFGAELAHITNTKPGTQMRAVYDPENGGPVAVELGYDAEGSLESLVSRKDIQAAIVATPNYLYKEPVLTAAEHGPHVFCGRPVALSFEGCRKMVDVYRENHMVLMTSHVANFLHGTRRAKELIGQGVIGDILYCHGIRSTWEGTGTSETRKKTRSKSGGHLYHHIYELDCTQFLVGGCPGTVTMARDNAAHRNDRFGDEGDVLFITMECPNRCCAVLECGSVSQWQEHYLLIQGIRGTMKIDICSCGMTLKTREKEEHFPVHRAKEEDDDRTRICRETEWDNGNQLGRPGRKPFLRLQGIMDEEMGFLNNVLHGASVTDELLPPLAGEAVRNSAVAADACALSLKEDREVKLSEITK